MRYDSHYNHLREASWRRKLTATEEADLRAWLAGHPEAQADWEAETTLNEALGRLPDAPVPSNFTARVLQAAERDATALARRGRSRWWGWRPWWRWLPRAAMAALVLGAGWFSYQQARVVRRGRLVASLEAVSGVSSLPSVKILEDYDAVRALNQCPPADEQLLALMQ